MNINIKLLILIFFHFLFPISGEVIITLINRPTGNITVSAIAEGTVYGSDYMPTNLYNGGTINTTIDLLQIDFYTSPNSSTIVFGYGKYRIEIDDVYVFVDMRDCNYPYIDNNDLYLTYDFNSGHFAYNGYNVTGYTVGIWLILQTEEHDVNCFLPQIVFKNEIDNTNIFGKLIVNNSIEVNSGDSYGLEQSSENTVRTKDIIREFEGINYKHHHWNNEINDVLYLHGFTADYLMEEVSKFNRIIELIINPITPDIIQFRDPWYAYQDNGSWLQPDAFRPLSDQGDGNGNLQVFLEQYPDQGPSYRLKAPRIMATVDGLYEFTGWSGVNVSQLIEDDPNVLESPVVFHEGATVTAEYTQVNNQPDYSFTVNEGEVLTIPENAEILFAAGFHLNIEGELISTGNQFGNKSVIR